MQYVIAFSRLSQYTFKKYEPLVADTLIKTKRESVEFHRVLGSHSIPISSKSVKHDIRCATEGGFVSTNERLEDNFKRYRFITSGFREMKLKKKN